MRIKTLWISLGDFIANISATHSPGDGCQGLAIAATYPIAQQSSHHRAYADANGTILCNRCGWLVRRCLGILLVGLRLCVLDLMVLHDLLRGCRYRCDGGSLCGSVVQRVLSHADVPVLVVRG